MLGPRETCGLRPETRRKGRVLQVDLTGRNNGIAKKTPARKELKDRNRSQNFK